MRHLLAALALVGGLGTASADPALATDDCAKARRAGKTCVLDVPAEPITGQAPTASGAGIGAVTFRPDTSLLRLRRDFLPEIVQAAEDLAAR